MNQMIQRNSPLWCALLLLAFPRLAHAELNVVATLPDLGAIAREVGGDHVKVTSLAYGTEDPHFVDPRPSFIRVLNRADVLIEGGAELEAGWLPPLVQASRNRKITGTGAGHVSGAHGVPLIDVPQGLVDRSQGDVHLAGNPHYLLDPENAKIAAANIAHAFSELDPKHAADYQSNLRRFRSAIDAALVRWSAELEPYRGAKVITYHKTFDYFLNRFGLVLKGTIEPKPGIEPSPSHVQELIQRGKAQEIDLVIIEPHRPIRTPEMIAETIGAHLLVLPGLVGGNDKAASYIAWIDYNVTQVAKALKQPAP